MKSVSQTACLEATLKDNSFFKTIRLFGAMSRSHSAPVQELATMPVPGIAFDVRKCISTERSTDVPFACLLMTRTRSSFRKSPQRNVLCAAVTHRAISFCTHFKASCSFRCELLAPTVDGFGRGSCTFGAFSLADVGFGCEFCCPTDGEFA